MSQLELAVIYSNPYIIPSYSKWVNQNNRKILSVYLKGEYNKKKVSFVLPTNTAEAVTSIWKRQIC